MRGLKRLCTGPGTCWWRRIFYRCVDWNRLPSTIDARTLVASFTDAWIETRTKVSIIQHWQSHLLQMRGLKLDITNFIKNVCHVASFTDAWIETSVMSRLKDAGLSRIFYRCVDWNISWNTLYRYTIVASFTDAWIETIISTPIQR